MARDDVRNVTKGLVIKSLADHVKVISFYSNEDSLKDLSRVVIYFIVRSFFCLKCEEWIWKDHQQRDQLENGDNN